MSHLDEGTLHALLDGELGSTELMEIEAHLDGCAACSARLRDAKEFFREADRLVGSVQFGRFAAAAPTSHAPAPKAQPVAPLPPPPAQPPREHHPWDDASPVLLIPDNPESSPVIRRWPRLIGWAATIAVAISGGYLASNIAKEESTPVSSPSADSFGMVGTAESDTVSSPSEPLRRDSKVISSANARESAPPPAASAGKAQPKPALAKSAPAKPAPAKQAPATASRDLAAKTANPVGTKTEGGVANRDSAADSDSTDAAEEVATKAAEQDAIRIQAAEALSQLDRERRLSRAAAATAALDRQAATRRESPAPAAAPPPPTLEQRSQVYLRIGLDEANKQLGGPVHVIEGMSPVFMGLAPGRVAAGADTTRPVVRVVYQDAQGRIIVLDQQRIRPGQAVAPGARGAWSLGDLTMGLQGEVPPEVLRTLRSRVR